MIPSSWAVAIRHDDSELFEWTGHAPDPGTARERAEADLALASLGRSTGLPIRTGEAMAVAANVPLEWRLHPRLLRAVLRDAPTEALIDPKAAALSCLRADTAFCGQLEPGMRGSVAASCTNQPGGEPVTAGRTLTLSTFVALITSDDHVAGADPHPRHETLARMAMIALHKLAVIAAQGTPYTSARDESVSARVIMPASQTLRAIALHKLAEERDAREAEAIVAMSAIGADWPFQSERPDRQKNV